MEISPLKVMQSGAGYYVGHSYLFEPEYDVWAPYSRESEYFRTAEEAVEYLRAMVGDDELSEDEMQLLDERNRGPAYDDDYAGWPE